MPMACVSIFIRMIAPCAKKTALCARSEAAATPRISGVAQKGDTIRRAKKKAGMLSRSREITAQRMQNRYASRTRSICPAPKA